MIHFGRLPQTQSNGGDSGSKNKKKETVHGAAEWILAVGTAMIVGFFFMMTVKLPIESQQFSEETVAVMSTAVAEEREELRSLDGNPAEYSAGVGVEPFGYLDGEWNLWEYLGDLVWSLLS